MTHVAWASLAVAVLMIGGCSHSDQSGGRSAVLPVTQLYAGVMCGRSERAPSATWITETVQLRKVYDRIESTVLPKQPRQLPVIDFRKERVLLIEMGQQTTAGYGLALSDEQAQLADAIAEITVTWMEPAVGSIQAQMVTSPCLIVKLPMDSYSRIRVVDQDRGVRLEIPIP